MAKTDCELIVINKADFIQVKENYIKILEEKKMHILEGFPILKTKVVSSNILENFFFFFENIGVRKGEYLCKEGLLGSERLYLILEGEFLVEKEVNQKDINKALRFIEGFSRDKTAEKIVCKPAKLSHIGKGIAIKASRAKNYCKFYTLSKGCANIRSDQEN